MGLTDPYTGMFPPGEMSEEETAQALRLDTIAELDAIDLYQAHINAIGDPEVRQVLEHVQSEEKQHAAEFLAALERLDPYQAKMLRERKTDMAPPVPAGIEEMEEAVAAFDRKVAGLALPFLETEGEFPDAPYGEVRIADTNGQPVRPTAVLGTTEAGEKCIAEVPLPDTSLEEWACGIGGSPGIIVDPGLARTTTCTRIDLGEGHKPLVYSPGIIGALDEGQQALYCESGMVEREASPAQRAHLQAMSTAAKLCSAESHAKTDPRERLEVYFSCLGRELAAKEAKATQP